MGADLIIEYIVIKIGETLKTKQSRMQKKIKFLTIEQDAKIREFYAEVYGEELDDEFDLNEVKQTLIEIVDETFNSLTARDVTSIEHKGETLYITGGMSWGDSPTDSYDVFYKFNMLDEILDIR